MSLVYEALQKAEREKERKAGPVIPVKPVAVKSPEPPRTTATIPVSALTPAPRQSYIGVLVACVSIVALAAIVFIVVLAAKSFAKKETPVPVSDNGGTRSVASESQPAALTEQGPPVQPATPPPANSTANDPRFKLTGIMKMGDNYGAVINGHIVYDTQYVDGAIVKKVERDRVTLNIDGREIVVRLF